MFFMMKDTIEELLKALHILPISNYKWSKFDVSLYSDSSNEEYLSVKKKIREYVPKKTSGIYIITKGEKVLYIGESEKNIHTRLKSHMDKIYIRTDNRADFFKLEEHQGDLSIYYWSLPSNLINKRRTIEELLTHALEPEYKKWDLKNKMNDIEKLFSEDNHLIQNENNNHFVELEDGDFYDELDKDDVLDKLGQHSSTGRKYWEKFEELSINYGADGTLTVNIGADNPTELEGEEAFQFATDIAKKKGYSTFYQVEDDIRLYGQNCLTERMFFFKK
jgi:hypothetical protein